MTRRFRYANAHKEIPACCHSVEVVHKASGEKLCEVIEANAEEGWLVRYVVDADGRAKRDGDEFAIERIEVEIDLLPGEAYPKRILDVNLTDDIAAGCVFDEDLTDAERSWLANGKPYCAECGRAAVPSPGLLCERCDRTGRRP